MSISENMAFVLQRYKAKHNISIPDMARKLEIAPSTLQNYMKGMSNPRASTIELIAEKMGLSAAELISVSTPAWEQSEALIRTTREFGGLSEEDQAKAIRHFRALVALLYGDN